MMRGNPQLATALEVVQDSNRLNYQDIAMASLPIDTFGRKRGMKSSQIHQSLVSEDGRLWCASPVGLVCYDGVTLRLFGRKNGLRCHGLRTLVQGPNNTLLLGSDAGVETVDISGTAPIAISFSNIGIVESLSINGASGVVGTPSGLYHFNENGSFLPSENHYLDKASISATLIDKAGDIWVSGAKFGLAVFTKDTWNFIAPQDFGSIGTPQSLSLGQDNTILVGGQNGLAILTHDKRLSHAVQTDKPVTAIHWADGHIWAVIGESLVRLKIEGEDILVHDKVLEHSIINDIISDDFKNVWVSTDDNGLHRVSGLHQVYKIDQNTDLGAVLCIKKSKSGKLIGGARGLKLPTGTTTLNGIAVWDALEDHEGSIWAASEQGLFKISKTPQGYSQPVAFGQNHPALAAPGRYFLLHKNALYVGSTKGLARIDRDGIREVLRPNGDSLGYVYSLHTGPNGKLWVATLGVGLWSLQNGRLTAVSGGSISPKSNVYSLCHSPSGTVYASHDGYISKIDDGGLPALFINSREPVAAWSLKAKDDKTLLAGTSDGLVIYDCETRKITRRVSNNTDTSNWEFTCSRALHIDDTDTVHCGVSSGLKTVNLTRLMEIKKTPEPALARVKWHQAHATLSQDCYQVDVGNWRFEVELQSCWFLDEDDCQMRYRLNGFDKVWSTLRPVHTISYTSLPPGRYSLEAYLQSPIAGQGMPKTLMDIWVR